MRCKTSSFYGKVLLKYKVFQSVDDSFDVKKSVPLDSNTKFSWNIKLNQYKKMIHV